MVQHTHLALLCLTQRFVDSFLAHFFSRSNSDAQMEEVERKCAPLHHVCGCLALLLCRLRGLARLTGAVAGPRLNYFPGSRVLCASHLSLSLSYAGWYPDFHASALHEVREAHKALFDGRDPRVYSVHAGLEWCADLFDLTVHIITSARVLAFWFAVVTSRSSTRRCSASRSARK